MTDTPDGTAEHLAELRNHFQQWHHHDLERLANAVLYAYLAQRDRIEALERRAIGIEIEEKYAKIAVQRLAQEVMAL